MKKDQPHTQSDVMPEQENPQAPQQPSAAQVVAREPSTVQQADAHKSQVLGKIAQIERLLQEIKELLK